MVWDGAPVDHKIKWNREGPKKNKEGDNQKSMMFFKNDKTQLDDS
jgi:hypothetical protein